MKSAEELGLRMPVNATNQENLKKAEDGFLFEVPEYKGPEGKGVPEGWLKKRVTIETLTYRLWEDGKKSIVVGFYWGRMVGKKLFHLTFAANLKGQAGNGNLADAVPGLPEVNEDNFGFSEPKLTSIITKEGVEVFVVDQELKTPVPIALEFYFFYTGKGAKAKRHDVLSSARFVPAKREVVRTYPEDRFREMQKVMAAAIEARKRKEEGR